MRQHKGISLHQNVLSRDAFFREVIAFRGGQRHNPKEYVSNNGTTGPGDNDRALKGLEELQQRKLSVGNDSEGNITSPQPLTFGIKSL